jgi:hypothetical protein
MRRSLVRKKEAGEQDMKLAEEDATADLAEEEVGYHLRGESSSLSQSLYVDWFAHLSLPLFFLTLRAQFPSLQLWFPLELAPALLFPTQPAPALYK